MKTAAVVLIVTLAGCAPLLYQDRPDPNAAIGSALTSLGRNDFESAYENLSWVHEQYWDRPVGERALVAMTAVELNPRNPGRRLAVAAELGGRFNDLPDPSPWNAPVAETLQLLAMELTVKVERLAMLEAAKERAESERDEAQRERTAARDAADRAEARARRAEAEAASARRAASQARAAAASAPPAPAQRPVPSPPTSSAREAELQRELNAVRATLTQQQQELERIRASLNP